MTTLLPASIANLVKPTVYLSCADTAKMIRTALKEAFPEIKFSVRSSVYAGGASIRVSWAEGPLASQVEAIAGRFQGASFDGMTDSMSYKDHALDGQPVNFGANYVFCDRAIDRTKADRLAEILNRADRDDWLTLAVRMGVSGSDVLRSFQYHPDAYEFASFMLRNLPQPAFDGRKSETADTVTLLSRDD